MPAVGILDVETMVGIAVPLGRGGTIRTFMLKAFDKAWNREIIDVLS